MKIKTLKKVLVSAFGQSAPLPRGAVIESTDPAHQAEFKALVNVNYAVVSTDKVTHAIASAKAAPPISGLKEKAKKSDATGDDADLLAILEGNTGEVTEALSALDNDQIARLGELEAEGSARKGVAAAITEALAAE